MTAPIDQLIVDEVARLLGLISVANGYNTDAGLNVLTEETRADIDPAQITLEIYDENESLETQSKTYRTGKLSITIDAQIPKGETSRATARMVLADMRRALTVEFQQWPQGAIKAEIGSRRIPPRDDGSQFVLASMDLSVKFSEQQPVTQPVQINPQP